MRDDKSYFTDINNKLYFYNYQIINRRLRIVKNLIVMHYIQLELHWHILHLFVNNK